MHGGDGEAAHPWAGVASERRGEQAAWRAGGVVSGRRGERAAYNVLPPAGGDWWGGEAGAWAARERRASRRARVGNARGMARA